jgi:hypothetical protein
MDIQYETFKDGTWQKVAESYSVETDFRIDPDALDAEVCALPPLMIRYGQLYSILKSEVSRKEEYAKFIYANLALKTRETEKVTESTVKEKVTVDPQYRLALADLNLSEKNAIMAETWWRSINKKADLVQSLTYRESSEIKRGAF